MPALNTFLTQLAAFDAASGVSPRTIVAIDTTASGDPISIVLTDGALYGLVVTEPVRGTPLRRYGARVDGSNLRYSRSPQGIIADKATGSKNLSELPTGPYVDRVSDQIVPLTSLSTMTTPSGVMG